MPNKKPTPLERIQKILQDEDFSVHHIPVNDKAPFESLYVDAGKDSKKRDIVISLNFVNDITHSLGLEDEPDDAYFLQFFLLFPFKIPQQKLEDTSLAALKLSRILPAGAFGTVEETGAMYYQYNLGCSTKSIEPSLLIEVINMMTFFSADFGNKLEQIAMGEKTRTELFKELKDNGIDFPPISPPVQV